VFGLAYCSLGRLGERGETAEKVKKLLRGEYRDPNIVTVTISEEERLAVMSELGDQLWYVSATARELGFSLEEVAKMNIEKITRRKAEGTIHTHSPDA
jgi:NTP pyrophosphatase (non-canonical NTP hydrolase)